MKTDSIGTIEWANVYGDSGYDIGTCVQQTTDSGYIVTGCYTSNIYNNSQSLWLLKTDKAGNTIWTKIYGEDNYYKRGNSVCETYDNGYIITGSFLDDGGWSPTLWVIKTDSLGDTIWSYSTHSGGNGYCIRQTSNNDYIIVGTEGYFEPNVYLIRIDALGDTLWTKIYGGSVYWRGYSVQQTYDGGFITCGEQCNDYFDLNDILILRTNANGDTLWKRTYGGDSSDEIGYSIQKTSDNGYVIVGKTNSYGAGDDDVWLLKLDLDAGVDEQLNTKFVEEQDIDPTIVRGVLNLQSEIFNPQSKFTLLDITGRKVANLKAGANNIQHLAPGIYFIRSKNNNQVIKIIVTR